MKVENDKSIAKIAQKLLLLIRQYSKVLLNWQSGITYLLCLLGLFIYEYIPLRFLQLFLSETLAKIHRFSGYVAFASETHLYIDGFWSQINKECTYMQLFFVTIPLVVRKETILRNLFRLCIYLILIFSVNIIRLILTNNLVLAGVSWNIAHGLVSQFTYGPILVIVFFMWIKNRLKRDHCIEKKQDIYL